MPCFTAIRLTCEYRRARANRRRTDRSRPTNPSPPPLGNAISARNRNVSVARNAHPATGMSRPANNPGDSWTVGNSQVTIRPATTHPTAAPISARTVLIRTPSTRRDATTSGHSINR
jgi:hypothetical protein